MAQRRPRDGAASLARSPPSPLGSVQAMQGLVARELVDGFGLSERQAATLLGLVPSAVSQYRSGKRLGSTLERYRTDPSARRLARRAAQELMAGAPAARPILEAAIALEPPGPVTGGAGAPRPAPDAHRVAEWLKSRIAGEQNAVAECMRLAQRSRDELTRALFRQIAADSLRHAEIVASLGVYLDRGVASSRPTGISREDVERLQARERDAEEASGAEIAGELGGVMRVLWESMAEDERKHELLLDRLLAEELPETRLRPGSRRESRPRGRTG